MRGDFLSRAASRDATTVDEEVTLMAGMANCFSCAKSNRALTSSPTITPSLRERTFLAIEKRMLKVAVQEQSEEESQRISVEQ